MASFAEVSSSKAVVQSYRAAIIAFTIYVRFSVLFAIQLSSSIQLELAIFAAQIFFLRALLLIKLLFAVNHASKVRLLAVKAFVESAGVHCEAFQITVVGISWSCQSLAVVQALVPSSLQ